MSKVKKAVPHNINITYHSRKPNFQSLEEHVLYDYLVAVQECYASNEYLCNMLYLSTMSLYRLLKQMEAKELISIYYINRNERLIKANEYIESIRPVDNKNDVLNEFMRHIK